MRDLLLCRSVLLAVLVSTVAMARGPDGECSIRTAKVSEHPGYPTGSVYVSGQVATVLRFDKEVDPTKTKLLGWEGRNVFKEGGGRGSPEERLPWGHLEVR
jgi:hypothetical protein